MNVSCPHCRTTFRVDPRKVPSTGTSARCSRCSEVFSVPAPPAAASQRPAPVGASVGAQASAAAPAPEVPPAPAPRPAARSSSPFGSGDPDAKARRLARALVSDIAVYYPERRERSLAEGTLRQEFRDEIRKSWEEYVAQVGEEFARQTPHFRDALNEVLARGARIF